MLQLCTVLLFFLLEREAHRTSVVGLGGGYLRISVGIVAVLYVQVLTLLTCDRQWPMKPTVHVTLTVLLLSLKQWV